MGLNLHLVHGIRKIEESMSSKQTILSMVKANQPSFVELPILEIHRGETVDIIKQFCTVIQSVGGESAEAETADELNNILNKKYSNAKKIVSIENGILLHAGKKLDYLDGLDFA